MAVCRRQSCRGGKGIDVGVFLFQLRQHGGQTRCHKVGHAAAPAVPAHPELQGAQRLTLCRRLNVSAYFFNQLPRRRHKAGVGAARPCMKVAGPLSSIAGAAQERPDDSHLSAAAHQRFAGDGTGHGVRGVVQAVGIVEQLHLGKAQLCKGVPDMVGAADLAFHPIALVALPRTVGGCRHAQGGQRQLVVVLCGRVVEQAVAVIVVVPQVGAVAVAAVPQGIVVVWHSPADQRRSRPSLRQRRSGCKCSRRKGHRKTLAKIPSFHGFILSHPPLRPVHRRLFYSIILFAAGCNFYLRQSTKTGKLRRTSRLTDTKISFITAKDPARGSTPRYGGTSAPRREPWRPGAARPDPPRGTPPARWGTP